MGQPYGSMSKRKERVDAVAAFIHGGGTPTLATISEQYGISPAGIGELITKYTRQRQPSSRLWNNLTLQQNDKRKKTHPHP